MESKTMSMIKERCLERVVNDLVRGNDGAVIDMLADNTYMIINEIWDRLLDEIQKDNNE